MKFENIQSLLNKCEVRDDNFNYISIYDKKKYNFTERHEIENFYELYDYEKEKFTMSETPTLYTMLRIDIDLKFNEEKFKFYNDSQIKTLISIINTNLKKKIKNCSNNNLICCLLEKSVYYISQKKKWSGGFHLQYPNLFLKNDLILNELILPIKDEVLEKTGFIFDNVYKNQWLLYGSAKSTILKPYLLTKIYNHEVNEISINECFGNYKLYNFFSKEIPIDIKNINKLYPRIFSIVPNYRKTNEIEETYIPINKNRVEHDDNSENKKNIDIEKNILDCRKLLPLISSSRLEEYNGWWIFGSCLHSLTNGAEEGLEMWDEKSKECKNYDIGGCDRKWFTMKPNKFSIGTLKYYAKIDNPEEYKKIFKKEKNQKQTNFEYKLISDEFIGKYIIEELYEKEKIYYSKGLNQLYLYDEFECLYVKQDKENLCLLFSEICEQYFKELGLYDKEIEDKNILKLISSDIYSSKFHDQINKQVKRRLKDHTKFIDDTFDQIPNLFPIANQKVIDFKTLKVRQRERTDYFTKTTQNIFLEEGQYSTEYIQNYIGEILKTVDQSFKDNLLYWCAYGLTNEIYIKKFPIFTGTGNNGKSLFMNLDRAVKDCFGENCNKKVIFESRAESVHSAHIIPLIGMRTVYWPEPSSNDKFDEAFIKSITGDDGKVSVRKCGGDEFSTILKCKFMGGINDSCLPTFNDVQGFDNRILKIPFENKFNGTNIKDELLTHKDEYFTILCHYAHKLYQNNFKFNISEQVEIATKEYKDDNDNIKMFLNENYIRTDNSSDRIKKCVLYDDYKTFCYKNKIQKENIHGLKFFYSQISNIGFEIYRTIEFKNIKKIEVVDDEPKKIKLLNINEEIEQDDIPDEEKDFSYLGI